MTSSAATSGTAILGSGGISGFNGAGLGVGTTAASVAPIIEPPASFGVVAPGIYRCSASSLTQGLPAASLRSTLKGKPSVVSSGGQSGIHANASASGISNTTNNNSNSVNSTATGSNNPTSTTITPTESFLASLQLKTVLLLAPEKRPAPLASWCEGNNIQLVHLGLGALANLAEVKAEENGNLNREVRDHLKSFETYSSFPDSGILSLERIVKDSLEILLHQNRLPCLVCDTSGVNETGVVVGCLRRMQRRNFASIRYEYRAFSGNRSRSSHERFIEMFDPDLISLPNPSKLPPWYALQQMDDDMEEANQTAFN
ncbi:hypothetical protein CBS101457_002074 [Exobasidium rhododendri]|nr:hypothetical protein CBS101457_002074 [Exobasidium rhododendri]